MELESVEKEQLIEALNEAMNCLEASLGMLAPYYSEELLQRLRDSYFQGISKKLEGQNDSELQ